MRIADRKTKVTLTAEVSGYIAGMEKAAQKTRETGTEAEKLAAKKDAINGLGQGLLAIGAVAAAGFGLAVAKFAEFDAAISSVKAATQASTEDMGKLRAAALEAGASTIFTATEAANAVEELGKAGLSTGDIIGGGLNGALSLAAAGELSVAEAAGIAAIAVKQFGLQGSDLPHVADLLAAGAGKAVGSVDDLAQALNQAGLVANGAGFSIEDTTGVLAAFADAGLLGSDAGTSLKNAIIKLQAPTVQAQQALDKYGISVYDSQGQMISFSGIAGQLQKGLSGVTDETRNAALSTIFGTDALRVANVLYEQGAQGIQKYVDQTNDAGYAAKVAADRLDNLKGDVEKLGGALDTALIQTGSGANDVLRGLVEGLTGLVDVVGSAPAPVLATVLALTGVVAVVGLVGGGALIAVPKIAQFKTALSTIGISAKTAAIGLGVATAALTVVTLAIGYFAAKNAEATANSNEFQNSLDQTTGAVTSYTREIVAKKLAESGAFEGARKAGISQNELTDAVIKGGSALDAVKEKLTAINTIGNVFDGTSFQAGFASESITDLAAALDKARDNYKDTQAATGKTTTQFEVQQGKVDDLSKSLTDLLTALDKLNGVGQDAVSTNAAYQQSLQDVESAIANIDPTTGKTKSATDALAKSVDESTVAGSTNAAMFSDLAKKSQDAAKAQFDLDHNSETYRNNLQAGRKTLYDNILALTGSADAAQSLTDKIYAIPSEKEFRAIVDTAQAQINLDNFIRVNSGKHIKFIVDGESGRSIGGLSTIAKADGGAIYGPGTGTSDSIPARLSNGEHVLTAAEVQRMGGQAAVYDFRRNLRAPTYVPSSPGFANGGAVGSSGDMTIVLQSKGGVDLTQHIEAVVYRNGQAQKTLIRQGAK